MFALQILQAVHVRLESVSVIQIPARMGAVAVTMVPSSYAPALMVTMATDVRKVRISVRVITPARMEGPV